MNLVSQIDKSWSLFLDRDGIINERIAGGYVKNSEQFVILPGVVEAMHIFRKIFCRIFLVTNQQGIGKSLMTENDLEKVHSYMNECLNFPFDRVYFCPELSSANSKFRKPEIGMALQAKKDFPEVDFSRAVMIGDAVSDMKFGENAGMKTVFIPGAADSYFGADLKCDSLLEFAKMLISVTRIGFQP